MKSLDTLAFYLFLILLLISMSLPLGAQAEACQYDIHLSTQAEVDAFAVPFPLNLPGAQPGVLYGSLTVGPLTSNGTTDITNLDGLAGLIQVTGTLLIEENPNLTDISGLADLTTIGTSCPFNELVIRGNPQITSIAGLSNLSGYVQRLIIRDMPLVTDIEALSGVTGAGFLWVGGMEAITHIDGLRNMTSLQGLFLTGNTNLLEIDGFSSVSGPFIQGQDFIADNPSLQNLNGLAGVTGTNILTVRFCNALTDLSGLGGLTEVTDQLSINNNAGLLTLNGLNPTLTIGGRLTIVGNTQLDNCAAGAVCAHLASNGENNIFGNAPGCESEVIVAASCVVPCGDSLVIVINNQEELDSVLNRYSHCSSFTGELILDEVLSSSVANPNVASRSVANSPITDLSGLASYDKINELRILNAPSLADFSALINIDSIGGELAITNTGATNLNGFDNLAWVGGRLLIANNPDLTTVSGFSSLNSVSRFLTILNNPQLSDLSGLAGLVTVGDILEIIGNPSLPDLTDFSSLRFTYDGLTIDDNDMLTSLAGLETLENINAGLRILNNDLLTDISTLDNLDQATIIATSNGAPGTAALIIRDNPLLSNCAIETVCTFLDGSGTAVDIQDNALNCESQTVVENNCLSLPISLLSFTASHTGKTVRLTWQTATEQNTEKYTLERSVDGGRNFEAIGSVAARNNPSGAEYEFIDERAASLNSPQLYYVLRSQDFDSSSQRFGPVTVNMPLVTSDVLNVYPNPVSANHTISIRGASVGAMMELRAVDGRLITTLSPAAGGVYNLPKMPAGVYLVLSRGTQGEFKTGRFVVR